MSNQRIGLTDEQKAVLDERLRDVVLARERAETAREHFNELVEILGGEGARYNQQEGVIEIPTPPAEGASDR